MKSIKKYILLAIILLCPIVIEAKGIEDPDYDVKAAYVNADVDFLGSMHIKEAIVVKGSLNGYRRQMLYRNSVLPEWEKGKVDFSASSIYNARGISLSKVSAKKIKESDIGWGLLTENYDSFREISNAEKGDVGLYTFEKLEDGIEVRTYNLNEDGYIVYYFDYYVNQAVVLHEDIAELYYTFFKLDSDDVENVQIQVTIPGECTDDTFRFWGHGALNGEISGISEKTNDNGKYLYKGVITKLEDYEKGDEIEVRMTFDKSIMAIGDSVLNKSGMNALDKIIEVETGRAEEANRQRKFIKAIFYGSLVLGSIYLLGLIILWIYVYIKYDREHKLNLDLKYYREFTGDYEVETVEYLMTENIGNNGMNASIMNLIYKGIIEIEEISEGVVVGDYTAKKNDIKLTLKDRKKATPTESLLIDFLFAFSKDNTIALGDIKKQSKNYEKAEEFMEKYNKWHMHAVADAKKEGFYESHGGIRAVAILYAILGIILVVLMIIIEIENIPLMLAIIILSILFILYVSTFKKRSIKGCEHYQKWKAFKNFLTDFGAFDEKNIPDIKLWDKYLVYATVFGIAKEVQKAMKMKITEMGIDEANVDMGYLYYYHNWHMMNAISSTINTAHTSSVQAINAHNASSSMSSGSGFGGGFSSGGGFAGGGGGGGGF